MVQAASLRLRADRSNRRTPAPAGDRPGATARHPLATLACRRTFRHGGSFRPGRGGNRMAGRPAGRRREPVFGTAAGIGREMVGVDSRGLARAPVWQGRARGAGATTDPGCCGQHVVSVSRHPASGHPLRDLPADRGLPTRYPQRGADRALPAGPSRSARPSRPVRSAARPSTPPVPSPAATAPNPERPRTQSVAAFR